MKISVLGLQGAVREHIKILEKAFSELGLSGKAEVARTAEEIESSDALVIPGGESTTISRLIRENNLSETIKKFAEQKPVIGTCAGMIVMGAEAEKITPLGLIDMSVERNAFGTQKDSFETTINFENRIIHAVFIRAPAVSELRDPNAKILSKFEDKIVAVQKGKLLALSFHPELSKDTYIHKKFINLI